jgi:predicted phage terminase large subunit-like protein|tara:strand:+ start:2098 stop:3615 length:1518 start_codon:yes stop_codon:yes gene_type:complete
MKQAINSKNILSDIKNLPMEKKREILALLEELEGVKERESCQTSFLPFVRSQWASFIHGRHHEIMAEAFEKVASGELKRLIINMPPRHTKSEFASYLFPAWFLGRYPNKKIIQTAHTAELSVGFGRKVRNLIQSEDYQKIFKGVALSADSKAAGRWNTNKGGEYFAIGVGGAVTGKGADVLVIDDPHSEQDATIGAYNPDVYDKVYEWYTSGPRQRLQPGGAIIIVMTRWSKRDLTGQIIKNSTQKEGSSEWEVIELPAIMPSGNALWEEFWKKEELLSLKAELPISKWSAQYQQDPTSEEGALIKREWWQEWDKPHLPPCEAIIQSWDTAFLKTQRADYSACTTWGIFHHPNADGQTVPNLILIDAYKEKLEFPELKKAAYDKYHEFEPDQMIIEAKAAGSPLIFELRAMGIPVTEFTPSRGQDKIARVNAVTDLFASNVIWHPPTRWADEVIEECAAFPAGDNDDLVDSTTQALLRFRQGGWIRTTMDDWDDEPTYRRPVEYY